MMRCHHLLAVVAMLCACAEGSDRNFGADAASSADQASSADAASTSAGAGASGPGAGGSTGSAGGSGGHVGGGAPAGAGGSNAASTGAGGGDGGTTTAGGGAMKPDLTVSDITRDATYYYVTFCNVGPVGGMGKLTILLTNTATNQSFESNPLYPFDIPAPSTCAMTGGFTCGLIGDPSCNQSLVVNATVDTQDAVDEADESNNDKAVAF
jgi:hypothetical protein